MEKIKVMEAFAGYGSQSMALELLHKDIGLEYEVVGISEIDKTATMAYYAARDERLDPNSEKFDRALVESLAAKKGKYQPTEELTRRYPNFGDITKINWENVPDFNLLTYSFPCTDISTAGLQKGLAEGSGTRSSLLWECAKAIQAKRPKYLLMENVKALVSDKFIPDFRRWMKWLEDMGYSNFYQVLNSKNFGVPQNRERIFMISILPDNAIYYFPKPFKLERRLKDVLERNVDESFYLSDCRVQEILNHCTCKGQSGINVVAKINDSQDGKIVDANGIAPTHTSGHGNCPKIIEEKEQDE